MIESGVAPTLQIAHDSDSELAVAAARERLEAIATNEFRRQRRRLGRITPEQEQAILTLLTSTLSEIFRHVGVGSKALINGSDLHAR